MGRPLRRTAIAAAFILLFIILLASVPRQGRTGVRTLLFLPQILPTIPIGPQEWVTKAPSRQEITFPVASGEHVADLYVPAGGERHGGVLLFLGVNPAGRDDSRVVGLAEGLARAGVVVMIPWSEDMTRRRVVVSEIDHLVNAFLHLRGLDIVDPEKVGMGGFCVGASFAAVAAQDERIRDQVQFVNFFGGYYDARDLVRSVVTRSRFYGSRMEPWNPDSLSMEVVANHLIEGVEDPTERTLLKDVFLTKTGGPNYDMERLSPEARVVYRLLEGPSYEQAGELMDLLPAKTQESLQRISPSTQVDNLTARVLIMHDREDSLVPAEESRRLADALAINGDAYYTEFSLFEHVDPTKPVSAPVFARELFKLYLHMYNVMKEMS